jgi:hypothetical protein
MHRNTTNIRLVAAAVAVAVAALAAPSASLAKDRIPELGNGYPPPKPKPTARAKQAGQLVQLGRYGSEFYVWIVNGKQRGIPFG